MFIARAVIDPPILRGLVCTLSLKPFIEWNMIILCVIHKNDLHCELDYFNGSEYQILLRILARLTIVVDYIQAVCRAD